MMCIKESPMTIYINIIDCNGCGACVEMCPTVFAMDEYGQKPVVLEPDAVTPCVDEAIVNCPHDAIGKD
jgi:ferredoxin